MPRTSRRPPAPCIFKKGFVTDTVDPLIDKMWKASIPGKVPFGDLRNQWRRHHCRTLNPYGDSENCPYDPKDCARAFYSAVREVVRANDRMGLKAPVGYFLKVARTMAAIRADEAVERRAVTARMRTDVLGATADSSPPTPRADPVSSGMDRVAGEGGIKGHRPDPHLGGGATPAAGGSALRAPAQSGSGSDRGVPSRSDGPVSVGDLFRSLGLGSREGPPDDREEGGG